jgi:hypothetical protein
MWGISEEKFLLKQKSGNKIKSGRRKMEKLLNYLLIVYRGYLQCSITKKNKQNSSKILKIDDSTYKNGVFFIINVSSKRILIFILH